ncbi:MAG: hypothetical protein ACI4AH_04125 [Muribaculaceae bacterium]
METLTKHLTQKSTAEALKFTAEWLLLYVLIVEQVSTVMQILFITVVALLVIYYVLKLRSHQWSIKNLLLDDDLNEPFALTANLFLTIILIVVLLFISNPDVNEIVSEASLLIIILGLIALLTVKK